MKETSPGQATQLVWWFIPGKRTAACKLGSSQVTLCWERRWRCAPGVLQPAAALSQVKGTDSTPALLLRCFTCWDRWSPYLLWLCQSKYLNVSCFPRSEAVNLYFRRTHQRNCLGYGVIIRKARVSSLSSVTDWGCEAGFLLKTNLCLSLKFFCLISLPWTKAVLRHFTNVWVTM